MSKNKSLKALIEKLMEDGHIKAKTPEGGRQTFYYHLSRGRIDMDFNLFVGKKGERKDYLWNDRQYPRIVRQLTKCLNK